MQTRMWPAVGLVLAVTSSVWAIDSTLTFDNCGVLSEGIIQAHGDNLPTAPDVTVSYNTGADPEPQVAIWDTGFGDLVNVVYPWLAQQTPNEVYANLELTFACGNNKTVSIKGFDMAAWSGSYPNVYWHCDNGSGGVLASGTLTVMTPHNHVDITGATARTIKLVIETSALGSNAPNVALDNVVFEEVGAFPMATVTGTVTPGGYSGSLDLLAAKIEFRKSGVLQFAFNQQLDAQGKFSLPSVPQDTYDIFIKCSCWLRQKVTANVNTTVFDLGSILLTPGDNDGDDNVTSSDLAIVLSNLQ